MEAHHHVLVAHGLPERIPVVALVGRQALDVGQLGHGDRPAALGRHAVDLVGHRVHVPRRPDRQRDEPPRMRGAPLVDVPVVVGLQHHQREVLVLRLLEAPAAEPGHAREAHRREDPVAVHVADPLVDEVRRRVASRPRRLGSIPHSSLGHETVALRPTDADGLALEHPLVEARARRAPAAAHGRGTSSGTCPSNKSGGSTTWSSMLRMIMSSTFTSASSPQPIRRCRWRDP